jgi:hypothetical protein
MVEMCDSSREGFKVLMRKLSKYALKNAKAIPKMADGLQKELSSGVYFCSTYMAQMPSVSGLNWAVV